MASSWAGVPVFCNGCFQPPPAAPALRLTSCGHLLCGACLDAPPGKKDVCVICRAPCRTVILSKEMNSDIQSLFTRIDGLCRKYSKEVSQISQFQEKHRWHLLSYYKGKITKLDGCLKAAQQKLHTQRQPLLKPHQETIQVRPSVSIETSVSKNQNEYASYLLRSNRLSTPEIRDPSMEVDDISPSVRKIERVAGSRISLISPPQNGHMGSVPRKGSQLSGVALFQNSTSESVRSTPLRVPDRETPYRSQIGSSQNNKSSALNTFGLQTPQRYQYMPASSLSVGTRGPISLADLLQKQHLGSAGEHLSQI